MTAIYGSKRAARFVADAFNRLDSVDVLCIGDSNMGYATAEGYGSAWSEAFWNLGGQVYGGPVVVPAGTPTAVSLEHQGDVGANAYPGRIDGTSGGVVWMKDGNVEGTPAIRELMRFSYGSTASGGDTGGFAPLRQGGSTNNTFIVGDDLGSPDRQASFDLKITAGLAFDVKDSYLYRVKYGSVNVNPSQFTLTAYTGSNTVLATQQIDSFGPDISELKTASLLLPADPSRTLTLRFSKCGTGQSPTAGLGLFGKAQWCVENVSCPGKKGIAVSYLHYGSGYQTRGINTALTEGRAQAKVLIQETYDRSVAAGNSGRLLFFTNLGTNGPDTVETWTTNHDAIIAKVMSICDELNIDRQKVAFLTSVTHPTAAPDPFASIRSAARTWASARNEDNVTFFDHSDIMDFTTANAAGWIHSSLSHLEELGYNEVTKLLFTNLIEYAKVPMSNTIATLNPMSTVAAYAPDFRGEATNQYTTPTLGASASVTLPAIETFPAVFLISQEANSAANSRCGFIVAHSASMIAANGGQHVSTSAGAQTIVPTIAGGVVTLTSNATFGVAAGGKGVTVIRIK